MSNTASITSRLIERNERIPVTFEVNGLTREVAVPAHTSMADMLRDLGYTSVKLGCEHGVCGSCTIIMNGQAVRSCLLLGVQAAGNDLETVESLATEGTLDRLQSAFHRHHALQCGFCTSGFLMLATAFIRENPGAGPEEIVKVISSNLCRCTGYEGILDAVTEAARSEKGGSVS